MSESVPIEEILRKTPSRLPRPLLGLLGLLVAMGLIAFVWGIAGTNPLRAWQAFLVNFLFWSGIAQAGLVFAAILQVTGARWGRPIKRISEGAASFLPISFLLFLVIFLGRNSIFPWIHEPIPGKEAWLNVPFLFARDGVGLIALYGLSLVFLYHSLRPDVGLAHEKKGGREKGLWKVLIAGWRGIEAEQQHSRRILAVLSPILLLLYALVFTLIAVDLVMSLDPHWYSNLFGGYYFIGNLYLGLAALAITSILARRYLGLEEYITPKQFHDLGKLIFGFCMLWTYLFWSQYLPIWYANLPEETGFVLARTSASPWKTVAGVLFFTNFLVPFVILLSRTAKKAPASLFLISAVIVGGMWLERFLLVVPSLWHQPTFPFGWLEVLILAGFFAAYTLTFLAFIRSFPILPIADPLFSSPERAHVPRRARAGGKGGSGPQPAFPGSERTGGAPVEPRPSGGPDGLF